MAAFLGEPFSAEIELRHDRLGPDEPLAHVTVPFDIPNGAGSLNQASGRVVMTAHAQFWEN